MKELRKKLKITNKALETVNEFLVDEDNILINQLFEIIEKYGGVNEINKRAKEASELDILLRKLKNNKPEYVQDIEWLIDQRDNNAFISIPEYRKKILKEKLTEMKFNEDFAVTLEISACQYFEAFMKQARQAIENQELMPGRFIRVRRMKEQEENDELLAVTAAMQIVGATWCETLDRPGSFYEH